MLLQAGKAVTMKPTPELVVVQGIDNDITCDKNGHRPFQVEFARVLDVLATGLPDARIFVVSQFGSVPTWIKALTLKQRINQRDRISGDSGPCAFLDKNGAPNSEARGVPRSRHPPLRGGGRDRLQGSGHLSLRRWGVRTHR